jgi:hypothetical protein
MKQIVLDNGCHSDFENNTDEDKKLDIDDFYFNYSNDILDIYEKIKEGLSYSPFFISNLKFTLLTDFILLISLHGSNKNSTQVNQFCLDTFDNYYGVEIEYSYNIICMFLKKFKRNLYRNTWVEFCFKHTDLHELKNK